MNKEMYRGWYIKKVGGVWLGWPQTDWKEQVVGDIDEAKELIDSQLKGQK